MKFTLDIINPQSQYLQITAVINVVNDETLIYLPIWRPGRYEAGNFAKNIRDFNVFNEKGEILNFKKQNKSTWKVSSKGCSTITVKYNYFAAELNAGSTFLDSAQLYVNPVNCFVFTDEYADKSIEVKLNIPENWKIAHSLKVKNRIFTAGNFDELVDSPFICSASLQMKAYYVENTAFYIWFNGIVKPDWEKIIPDFEKFTRAQIEKFTDFPSEEYHFLFFILPYKIYHGVEHSKSTVITLGPGYAVFEEFYSEFLGVSSHELYHTWNVKTIRPKDWMPYNFKEESYSELGYIAEGVTTYMGDLILYKSDVFSLNEYLSEMNVQLQKHFNNFGRFHLSVADSSYDTWLDGYVPGAPARKVSIYTEGCLLAFITDVLLIKHTDNKYKLDDVMRNLYLHYGKTGKGITERDYQNELEKISGISWQWFFNYYIHGTKDYLPLLEECFTFIGLKIEIQPDESEFAAYLGAKIEYSQHEAIIQSLYPGGILEKAGVMIGDKIMVINGIVINKDAERWAKYFREDDKTILFNRNGQIMQFNIPKTNEVYFKKYYLSVMEYLDEEQISAFESWRK